MDAPQSRPKCLTWATPDLLVQHGMQNPEFWNVSIMLFTALALDFLLAYLPSLSFRHLVCFLLSRDKAWIVTQLLCFVVVLWLWSCWLRPGVGAWWKNTTWPLLSVCRCFPARACIYCLVCNPLCLCKTSPLNATEAWRHTAEAFCTCLWNTWWGKKEGKKAHYRTEASIC